MNKILNFFQTSIFDKVEHRKVLWRELVIAFGNIKLGSEWQNPKTVAEVRKASCSMVPRIQAPSTFCLPGPCYCPTWLLWLCRHLSNQKGRGRKDKEQEALQNQPVAPSDILSHKHALLFSLTTIFLCLCLLVYCLFLPNRL